MVWKKDGTWRPCGDYRRLIMQTTQDWYLLPNVQDCNNHVRSCTILTHLDLEKDYHQVPVVAADIPRTTMVPPFGLFKYVAMPFGLKIGLPIRLAPK